MPPGNAKVNSTVYRPAKLELLNTAAQVLSVALAAIESAGGVELVVRGELGLEMSAGS